MITLTRMFLSNWGQFDHRLLTVPERASLDGISSTDWGTLLDALRLVLLANLDAIPHLRVPPDADADADTDAAPDTDAVPDAGSSEETRPAPRALAYVALEWADTRTTPAAPITTGACVEYLTDRPPACTFFLMPETLDPDMLLPDGKPATRRELKQSIRSLRDAHAYDQPGEYRADLLAWFGDLSPRFFDLFERALVFRPPDDLRQFVNQWLLEPRPLDVETLQRVAEPYALLSDTAREIEEKLTALRGIVQQQEQVRSLRYQRDSLRVLLPLLHRSEAEQQVAWLEERLNFAAHQHDEESEELAATQTHLSKAEAALRDAEIRIHQTSVMRRRDELQRDIKRATSEATMVQSRWLTLLYDIQREEAALRPLLEADEDKLPAGTAGNTGQDLTAALSLTDDERAIVQSFLDSIAALRADNPPSRDFFPLMDAAIPALEAALARAQEALFAIKQQIQQHRARGKELEQQRAHVRAGGRRVPAPVERLRDLLTHILEQRPPLLCEVLEIPDPTWQDAVEALLGPQRFAILVQPRHLDLALHVLARAQLNEHLYDVGILDIEGALHQKTPPQEDSIAHQVQTPFPALRSYIDTLFGDTIACTDRANLRRYRRAVTPDATLYANLTMRTIPAEHYRPWVIGERAHQHVLDTCAAELRQINETLVALGNQSNLVNTHIARLRRVRTLATLRQRLDAPLDERPIRSQIATTMAKQQTLDESEIEEQKQEIDRLHDVTTQERAAERHLIASIASWEAEHQRRTEELADARRWLTACQQRADAVREQLPHAVASAEEMLPSALPVRPSDDAPPTSTRAIAEADERLHTTSEQLASAMQQLVQAATAYNTRYAATAKTDDPDDEWYATEEHRLTRHDLPTYKDQLEQARRQAVESLLTHVLVPLRARLGTATQQIERLNQALSRFEIAGKRYRFALQHDQELASYAALMNELDPQQPPAQVMASDLYRTSRPVFDQFYALLTRTPGSEDEQHEQARLLDYRSYFRYELEVMGADEQHIPTDTPTQPEPVSIPCYLVIAAAFARLYRLNERDGREGREGQDGQGGQQRRSTLRLVPFNETFGSLPSHHRAALLDVFARLNLQTLLAAP